MAISQEHSENPPAETIALIVSPYQGKRSFLVTVLQEIQQKLGYLPPEVFSEVARQLQVSPSEVFGVATFYAQFRYTPPARHELKICRGTACHMRGAQLILEAVSRELNIPSGGMTPDRKFGLEEIACFGCCALSPVMVIGNTVYSKLTPEKAKSVIGGLT